MISMMANSHVKVRIVKPLSYGPPVQPRPLVAHRCAPTFRFVVNILIYI